MPELQHRTVPENSEGQTKEQFLESEVERQALEIATLTRLLETFQEQLQSHSLFARYDANQTASGDTAPPSLNAASALVVAARETLSKICGRYLAALITERIIMRAEIFDRNWYLEQNSDVRSSDQNPLKHYINYGAAERRTPHPRLLRRTQ